MRCGLEITHVPGKFGPLEAPWRLRHFNIVAREGGGRRNLALHLATAYEFQ